MNFKPTLWKTLIPIIVLIILPMLALRVGCNALDSQASCPVNFIAIFMLAFPVQIFIISVAVLIYIIWSLVQKK